MLPALSTVIPWSSYGNIVSKLSDAAYLVPFVRPPTNVKTSPAGEMARILPYGGLAVEMKSVAKTVPDASTAILVEVSLVSPLAPPPARVDTNPFGVIALILKLAES